MLGVHIYVHVGTVDMYRQGRQATYLSRVRESQHEYYRYMLNIRCFHKWIF